MQERINDRRLNCNTEGQSKDLEVKLIKTQEEIKSIYKMYQEREAKWKNKYMKNKILQRTHRVQQQQQQNNMQKTYI